MWPTHMASYYPTVNGTTQPCFEPSLHRPFRCVGFIHGPPVGPAPLLPLWALPEFTKRCIRTKERGTCCLGPDSYLQGSHQKDESARRYSCRTYDLCHACPPAPTPFKVLKHLLLDTNPVSSSHRASSSPALLCKMLSSS